MWRSGARHSEPFGRMLGRFRRAAGLTQRELADLAESSVSAIRDLEQCRTLHPRPALGQRLVRALQLDTGQAAELLLAASSHVPSPLAPDGGWYVGVGLKIRVLGSVAVWRDGVTAELGGARQRAILGFLAVHAGSLQHRETIIDAVWGNDSPTDATSAVQAHMSRLRRVLDPGRAPRDPAGLLVSSGASYQLNATAEQLDMLAFRQLIARARTALGDGNGALACELYERAIDMWQADPLADLDVLRSHPAVAGLARERLAVLLDFADACEELSEPGRALRHLWPAAAREPLSEPLHAHLMIALASSGQQAAALQVYDELRLRLDEQLAVLPGPELSAAHARVLRQELPREHEVGRPRQASALAAPRQLPATVPYFTGRQAELSALTRLLDGLAGGAGTIVIGAIGGSAGIGKTALAVHWAHRVADRFPDGHLYMNLRGFGPPGTAVTPAQALRGFLDALGVPAGRIPADMDAQTGLYRSLLADKRVLVVLDNARDEAQVRPLLPASARCLVLVTSRRQLSGLVAAEGAYPVTLDLLSEDEARRLLARRLGSQRTAAQQEAVTELVALCARLPLALNVVAARAAARPDLPLATLATELRKGRDQGNTLDIEDPAVNVRIVFRWSYVQLTGPAARMFRFLGLHPGPDITVPAAASLCAIRPEQARELLRDLANVYLLTEHRSGRYTCHDLLRAYAASQAQAHDTDADRREATHRVLDHYLHTAHAAALLEYPMRDPISLTPPRHGVMPEPLSDRVEALAWFKAEHKVLLAAITEAAEGRFDRHAWQLAWCLADFLDRGGQWHDWANTQHTALVTAQRLGDRYAEAGALRYLGTACFQLAGYAEARRYLSQALRLFTQLGDQVGQARTHLWISQVLERQGRNNQALSHDLKGLGLFRAAGQRAGEARALNSLGWGLAVLGDYKQALTVCQEAVDLCRELGDHLGEAAARDSLGYIHHRLGHRLEALASYRNALGLLREFGDRRGEADVLIHLGDTYHVTGQQRLARLAWQRALAILNDLDHPDAAEVRAKLDGPGPDGANRCGAA